MPSLVKIIALIAGTGTALGVYITTAGNTRSKQKEAEGELDSLPIEPLLDRMEQLEAQIAKVQANGDATAQVQFLRRSIAAHETELQALRLKVDETERRAAAAVESSETRLRQFRQEIEAQVEVKVAERIGALERAMADQLTSVGGLHDRAVESDANLQRLIAVVERLSERPQVQPSPTVLPFEAQLAEAVERDRPGEPRVRVIKENETERRHRFPLGRTFVFLLAALLPGLHR